MYTAIHQYLATCVQLSAEQLAFFDQSLNFKSVPKKTLMLREGEICTFEAFILQGCVKTYFLDQHGSEVILTFATENWWISDLISFYEQKPSKMFIETLEDTQLLFFTPQTKARVLEHLPALERVFRLMVQRHLATYQERLFNNLALTAEERYLHFLEKYPELPNRIPQHLIATYLGITAEFLSRIRRRKLK